jgi:ParB family chromosome partitioning protein
MAKKTPMKDRIRADFFGVSADIPRIVEIDIANIQRNPNQPRQTFDPVTLDELAASIQEKGLLQPIVVQKIGDDRYMIVAGERRFRACQQLGRPTIAAIVSDGDIDEIALIENIQREDLKPVELAEALARLIETHQYTHEVAAKMLGKARNTVTELLSINRLDPAIREECRTSDIASKSLLVEIARMEPERQTEAWAQAKNGTATVRAARAAKASAPSDTGADAGAGSVAATGKKPKIVYSTPHGASVIVQAEASQALTKAQIVAALREALGVARRDV